MNLITTKQAREWIEKRGLNPDLISEFDFNKIVISELMDLRKELDEIKGSYKRFDPCEGRVSN